ncbi:MAG: GNAT family N-acetyltransferase [Pedobacter sp.]|nr:MAG: GNAT family N-acetyltransferase [Pedobacter sp.]
MMIIATQNDRERIIEILSLAFDSNASVDYVVKQDVRRTARIRSLMDYSYQVCAKFGKVMVSEDRNAAALVLRGKKSFSLRALWWDLALVIGVTGLRNVMKVLRRESLIKAQLPAGDFYYLWFIGVDPAFSGRGIGSGLLKELMAFNENSGL